MRKQILCFGDSNTWGYMPGQGTRYPENVRWTGRLAEELGDEYHIVEEGLNGRTTVFSDLIEPERCGMEHIKPTILSHLPLDYVIVMLGSNDSKTHFNVNAVEIGYGIEELLLKLQFVLDVQGSKAKIIMASPTHMYGCKDPMFNQKSEEKVKQLAGVYQQIAKDRNWLYMDAASVVGDQLGIDGIHMTEKGHEKLGKAFAEFIKEQERC